MKYCRITRSMVSLFALTCVALIPGDFALAAGDDVHVQVAIIHATKANGEISKELQPMAESLKKIFKYTGYKLKRVATESGPIGKELKLKLDKPYEMMVTPTGRKDGKTKLDVRVMEREGDKLTKRVATTLAIVPGKSQLMGGWSISNGNVLILAVSAK